ncbi:MAG TPA: glutaredoxin family protein [Actinomycetota bacterium]|nr:glutaredoxin family protein [Actinomycetota bacterium]
MARVTMYSRRRCGLCDEARSVVLDARHDASFEFEEIFIDEDPALEEAYGLRVPVVAVDGREEFEIAVDGAALRRLVAR